MDHCRIGSLEILVAFISEPLFDHCRIGSLEILLLRRLRRIIDHCRIGSLEMFKGIQVNINV